MGRSRSNKALASIVLLATLILVSRGLRSRAPHSPPPHPPAPATVRTEFSAKVTNVRDGDSIDVEWENQNATVRLYGIDCPEWKQDFGDEARAFTRRQVMNREVSLTIFDRDKYDRLIAEVKVEEQSLNAALVKEGLAWAYRKYSDKFISFEEQARKDGKGIWSKKGPIPPWEFRGQAR